MRHLLIIGPPAAGKLTIAKRIASTGQYFLFDNHRSIDAVRILSEHQALVPQHLCHAIRRSIFQAAAASNIPTIFTMVYEHPADAGIMQEYEDILTNDRPPMIVQLHCSLEDAMTRCSNPSRQSTSKIVRGETIEDIWKAHDVTSDYKPESVNVLHINTSQCSVEESVQAILKRL